MQAVLWAILFVYILVALWFGAHNNIGSIKFFIGAILSQNFFLILFSNYLSSTLYTLFTAVKEIMLYEMAIIGFIKFYKAIPKQILLCVFVLIIMCLKNLFISDSDFWTRILTLRQMLIPLVCLMVGFGLRTTNNSIQTLSNFIINVSVLLAVFGFIELILGDKFWINLGYLDYLAIKEGEISGIYNGVTVNFYTWDIGNLIIRRLVSFTADPLATAHWLFIGFILCFNKIKIGTNNLLQRNLEFNKYLIYLIILFVACILTFSKAVLVLMLVFIAFNFYFKIKKSERWILLLLGCLAFIGLLGYVGYKSVANQNISATGIHFKGLIDGIVKSSLFGNGLGTAGFVASFTDSEVIVGESFIGVTMYQIGWVGIIFYGLIFIFILIDFSKLNNKISLKLVQISFILILGLIVEMLLSESSVSIIGTSLYFILVGIFYRQIPNTKKFHSKLIKNTIGF